MGEIEQLDIFGNAQDWNTTTPKAQEKNGTKARRQNKQQETDDLVVWWMGELAVPLSCDELIDRLRPIGLTAGQVTASVKRLRRHERIKTQGPPDPNCEQHQAVHNSRWIPS